MKFAYRSNQQAARRAPGFRAARPSRLARRTLGLEPLEARALLAVVNLVTETTASKGIVATQAIYDDAGTDWNGSDPTFDDSLWLPSLAGQPNGIGAPNGAGQKYAGFATINSAAMVNTSNTSFLRIPFTVANAAAFTKLTLNMRFDDGFIAYLNGQVVARQNVVPDEYPAWNSAATVFAADATATFTTFDVTSQLGALKNGANVLAVRGFDRPQAGSFPLTQDFVVQATLSGEQVDTPATANNDAVAYRTDQADPIINVLANDTPGTSTINATTVQVVQQPAGGTVTVNPISGAITYRETAGFAGRDTFTYRVRDNTPVPTPGGTTVPVTVVSLTPPTAHRRLIPTAPIGAAWNDLASPGFDDTTWTVGSNGIGYENDVAATYTPYIASGNVAGMFNVNGSVYSRFPFTVADPTLVTQLRLRMRYDDGFVAYINGVKVAEANAPATPAWNSLATLDHPDAQAVVQQEFVIPLTGITLRTGNAQNILAIQGFNLTLGSSDFLIEPELITDTGTRGLWSNEATVTVDVTGPGPTTVDDFVTAQVIEQDGNGVDIPVLANDTPGFSGFPIRPDTVRITSQPANGTVVVDAATGVVNYQPDAGFWGDDVFSYTVRDADPVFLTQTLVALPRSSPNWKYTDSGTDPGATWKSLTFNDSSWKTGAAQLGYGDTQVTTIATVYPSAFFRKTFDLPATNVQQLKVRLLRDDGAAVYINGVEVRRDNLAANAPWDAFATATVDAANEETYFETVLDAAALATLNIPWVAGTNVVAVEAHQVNGTSSDIGMDVELEVTLVSETGNISTTGDVLVHVNAPPVAVNDTIEVGPFGTQGTLPSTITFDPLVNDSDPDNSPSGTPGVVGINPALTVITQAPPSGKGTATVNPANGRITYTAAPSMTKPETVTFRYRVFDYQGAYSQDATVTVNLVVAPPTATNDTIATPEGQAVAINVLANDIRRDLPIVQGSIVPTQPANGTVTLNTANNTLLYTPRAGFRDQFDTFTYTISDAAGNRSTPATVTVDVFSLAIAREDGFALQQGASSVTIPIADILANDYYPSSFQPEIVIAPNSQTKGTAVINVVGGVQQSITFTPSAGATGVAGFSYFLRDAVANPTRPNSNTTRVNIALSAVNISGKVYVDVNRNGQHELGEQLVPEATIVLTRAGDPNFRRTTLTSSDPAMLGQYSFASTSSGVLPPDTYTITEIQPALYLDFTTGAVNSYTVALSAPSNPGYDFREWTVNPQFFTALASYGGGFLASQQPVSLSASSLVVPYDLGWNGTFSARATYNPALGDVSVKLYNSAGAVVASSATSGGSTPGNSVINYAASPSQKLVLVVSGTNPNVAIDAPSLATTSGDTTPPFVYDTAVSSTRWSSGFALNLAEQYLGTNGYKVAAGETLPWQNLDRISMRFTEPVAVSQGDLRLWGVNVADYPQTVGVQSFSYDPTTFTATWTLSGPIATDQLRVGLSDAVRDVWGNRVGGTGYSMLFNVLPGAIPGVGSAEGGAALGQMMSRQFASVGQARYSPYYDLDGNGVVNFVDAIGLRNALGASLPLGTPGGGSTSTPSPQAPAAVVVSTSRASDGARRREAEAPLVASRAVVRATRAAAVDAVVDTAASAAGGANGGTSLLSALRARRAARSADRVLSALDGAL